MKLRKRPFLGLSAAVVVIAALSGCGRGCETVGCGPAPDPTTPPPACVPTYTFDNPGLGYEADECMRQCYRKQTECMEDARLQKESCEHYNAMARIEFGRCVSSGATNCYNSVHQCSAPNTKQCEEEFRRCYAGCGGIVTNSCDAADSDK